MRTVRNAAMAAALLLAAAGCSVTRIVAKVDQNPLKQVAEKAAVHYSVTWVDDNTLKLRDTWNWYSLLTLSHNAFRADLQYDGKQLHGTFYLKTRPLLAVLLPFYAIYTSPNAAGLLLRPALRTQMREVLDWAGVKPSGDEEKFQWGSP